MGNTSIQLELFVRVDKRISADVEKDDCNKVIQLSSVRKAKEDANISIINQKIAGRARHFAELLYK